MKGIAMAIALMALLSFSATSFASDWGMVGKVLTGIEGARILTGGKFDVIGNVMDIAKIRQDRDETVYEKRVYVVETPAVRQRAWVPDYTYREVWVPGHYVRYQAENGGHYVYSSSQGRHDRDDFRGRGGRR